MTEAALHKYFPEADLAAGDVYLRQLYVVMTALGSPEGATLRTRIAQGGGSHPSATHHFFVHLLRPSSLGAPACLHWLAGICESIWHTE